MKKTAMFSLLSCLALQTLAFANQMNGSVFSIDEPNKKAFRFTRSEETKNGKTIVHSSFTYPDGKEAVHETVIYKGNKLISYVLYNKQDNSIGKVRIEKNKLILDLTENGKTKTNVEDLEPNTIVGDQLEDFAQKNWDALLRDKTIHFRFIAPERGESFGFKFWKESEISYNGRPAIVLHMKASSFIIALIAGTIKLTFDKQTRKLVEVDGHLPPKKRDGDGWTDFYGKLVIHHPDKP